MKGDGGNLKTNTEKFIPLTLEVELKGSAKFEDIPEAGLEEFREFINTKKEEDPRVEVFLYRSEVPKLSYVDKPFFECWFEFWKETLPENLLPLPLSLVYLFRDSSFSSSESLIAAQLFTIDILPKKHLDALNSAAEKGKG